MSALESELQHTIETIYRIDRTASVSDFRIGEELLAAFVGDEQVDKHRETLVVRDEGGEVVDLALYLSEEVVERAKVFAAASGERHLDEFCVATEGVSHFVYVTFCGDKQDRPVSQIELELQAEIDKYLVVRLLYPNLGEELVPRLYDRFTLAERLTHRERERYTVANRAGRRYARWLHRELSRGRGEAALRDARALYRKPLAAKLEQIDRAA
jgi:hypothetical protein